MVNNQIAISLLSLAAVLLLPLWLWILRQFIKFIRGWSLGFYEAIHLWWCMVKDQLEKIAKVIRGEG